MALPAGMRHPDHRVQRVCDPCATVNPEAAWDDHPRHLHVLGDGTVQSRHMDCCAAAGCPDGTCPEIVAASGGAKGADLVAHLRAQGPNEHAEG